MVHVRIGHIYGNFLCGEAESISTPFESGLNLLLVCFLVFSISDALASELHCPQRVQTPRLGNS
jgi:hypothetical protein